MQLALKAGDAVFLNPALMHAAGSNFTSDIHRMNNLLQIGSAFGRTMETVDRTRTSLAIYKALFSAKQQGMAPHLISNVIASSAEGYSFPGNLDLDPPIGGKPP